MEDYKSVKRDITKSEPTEDAGYIKSRRGIWFSSEDKIRERLRKTIEF